MGKFTFRLFFIAFIFSLFCKGSEVIAQISTITYSYTGSNQTFAVPANVNCITVQAWGGGGGGGGTDSDGGGNGGGGAYSSSLLVVTPGANLTIIVGGGGGGGYGCATSAAGGAGGFGLGNGGTGGDAGPTGCSGAGGGGGGGTGIMNGGTILIVAGGGGGAGGGGQHGAGTDGGGGGVDGVTNDLAAGGLTGASSNSNGLNGTQSSGDGGGGSGGGGGLVGGGNGGFPPGADVGGSGAAGGTSLGTTIDNGSGETPGNAAGLSAYCTTCATGATGINFDGTAPSGGNGFLIITYYPMITATITNTVICGIATATVNPSGGAPGGYTYSWTPTGGTGQTAINLTNGNYVVDITDGIGCTGTGNTTIAIPPALNITATSSSVSCYGLSTGSATAVATGGTGPTYTMGINSTPTQYSVTAGTFIAGNLPVGSYTFGVQDGQGCQDTVSIKITQPANPLAITTTQTNVSCFGGANGIAVANPTGGTVGTGYTYSWSPIGGSAGTANNLTSQDYTVIVKDGNSCTATSTLNIAQPALPVSASINATDITCNAMSNGSATVTAGGGTAGYTYNWLPIGGTASITTNNLSPQNYSVTVTDANNCSATQTITITQPQALAITTTVTNVTCFGLSNGSATATVTGGTGPTYTMGINSIPTQYSVTAGTFAASNLHAASYTFGVQDANGCMDTSSILVTQPPLTVISVISPNPACDTTKLDWVTWSSVNATSGVGTISSNLNLTLTKPTGGLALTPTMFNGSSFPTQYNIPISNQALENTLAGVFTFCFNKPVVAPQVAFSSIGNSSTSVPIITSAPYAVIWQGTNVTYPNDTTLIGTEGNTIIQFPGEHTCLSFNYQVSENYCNLAFGIRDTNCQTTPICKGSPATFTTTGAVSYTWSPATGLSQTTGSVVSANPPSYQTYTIVSTDIFGCHDTATTSVTVNSLPIAIIDSITNVSCFGGNNGSILLNVTSGTTPYTYLWTNGNTSIKDSMLIQGTYSVYVTDANNCKDTISGTITQPALLTASITSSRNDSCFGNNNGNAVAGVSGGTKPYAYSWNTTPIQQTDTASNLFTGNYTVTVTDTNNCVATTTVSISQPPALTLTATETDVTCFGLSTGSATATASGGTGPYTYGWGNPPQQISITGIAGGFAVGTYTAYVLDAKACLDSVAVTINQPALLKAAADTLNNVSCFGGNNGKAIVRSNNGGTAPYTYSWTPIGGTDSTGTGLSAYTYTATITDAHFCKDSAIVTITQPPALTLTIATPTICISKTATLTANVSGGTAPYNYFWNGVAGTQTNIVNPVVTTLYEINVVDSKGCKDSIPAPVSVRLPLSSTVNNNIEICNGFPASLSATGGGGDNAYTYTWIPGSFSGQFVTVHPSATTTYTLILNDGCGTPADSSQTTVIVDSLPQISFTSDKTAGCYPLCIQYTSNSQIAPSSIVSYSWNLGGGYTSDLVNPLLQCYPNPGVYSVDLTATSDKGCVSRYAVANMITVYDHPIANFSYLPNPATILSPTIQFYNTSTFPGSSLDSLFWQTFGDGTDSTSKLQKPVHAYQDTGTYCVRLIVTNKLGCKDTTQQCVVINPYFTLYIPNTFSPNGDGINDVFYAIGEYVSSFDMKIFDRWGSVIYHSGNILSGWSGSKGGDVAEQGVYVYIISATDALGKAHSYNGTVTIIK